MKTTDVIRWSFLAGVAIGIAGFGYLALGGLAGSILFAFGLMTVVNYKMKLFTGMAGIVKKDGYGELFIALLGNIMGCLAVAWLARLSSMPLQDAALKVLKGRLATGAFQCGALAIGCGFIVNTAVVFAKQGKWLPLLFGVPMFIVCGFPHCIADAFYYLTVPFSFISENLWNVLLLYVCIVAGNFIGCNFVRAIAPKE